MDPIFPIQGLKWFRFLKMVPILIFSDCHILDLGNAFSNDVEGSKVKILLPKYLISKKLTFIFVDGRKKPKPVHRVYPSLANSFSNLN